MKIILLAAGGRAGSDFFHSLLDGHPEILQFPGYFRVDDKINIIINANKLLDIANLFVKFYPEFFDSKKNKFERWDKLGERKNKCFKVNKKKFAENFLKLSNNEKKLTNLKILINLHLAYFLAQRKSIKKIKILFVHTHLLNWTKNFIKIFNLKKIDILHTIRHPLSSLGSPLKTWLNYKKGKYFYPKDLYYQIDTVINCINDLKKLGKVHIVQLERLHKNNNEVMKNFCKNFNIRYEKTLKKSTKNNLKWWADAGSNKNIDGINKNFKVKIYQEYFYNNDLIYFQNLTKKIIKKYKYKFYFREKEINLKLSPLKCEKIVWKNTFKHLFVDGFRWKHLLSIPFFYFLRIIKINNLFVNQQRRNLPNAF